MTRQLTIRHDSPELVKRLKARAEREGKSVNTWVVEALERAVGLNERVESLKRYTTWTEDDLESFNGALRAQRTIDEDLWR
jgi:plasmid stability protein